ncbi:trypsin I-P1-like isoform X2 [Frankliniella occidentalis]|uniref:Trypsin I-P1-like isoform X2 n=1 Tax=Frankliniella occidentalis TaxID=133901 RepID=A0A6J1SGA1_FRAOC|nr:trypsin I-P1-like isoform X2 [Frankliniella occidentalis]
MMCDTERTRADADEVAGRTVVPRWRSSASSTAAEAASATRRSPPVLWVLALALQALLLVAPQTAAGSSISLPEAKAILDKWRPEVHGAVAVKVGEIPYQASIRLYSPEANQHKCGGAIISPWHILTAARCISYASPLAPESVFVVVGAVKRSSLDEGDVDTVVRKVAHIARHPDFSSRDQRNDLALLTLSVALPMHKMDRVAQIPLPVGDIQVRVGTTCVVSGWGNNTGQTLIESDALLTAEVPFIGRDLCAMMYEPTQLPAGVICTAHQKGGAGACVGDPGGPLVCNGFLAGTVSWGSGCGSSARPTVYTSLADHVAWVRDRMADNPRAGGGGGGGGGRPGGYDSGARGVTAAAVLLGAAALLHLCRDTL